MKGKCIAFFIGLLIVTTFFNVSKAREEGEIELTFNFSQPIIKEISIEGKSYMHVFIPSISNGGNPGEPYLPVKPAYVLLPYKTKVSHIEVIVENEKLVGNGLLLPAPQPIRFGDEPVPPQIKEEIYSKDVYPNATYKKVGVYSFRGYEILIVNLYPVKYMPKTGDIYYYEKMKLKIYTERCNIANKLYRGLEKDREEVIKKVDNPKEAFSYPIKKSRPMHNFVIITSNTYNISGDNTFQDLASFKNSQGIDTVVVTVEDIESNPNFWNTSYAIFNDTQAKIRNFIRYAYLNWGIEYVLLGGDADDYGSVVVPARDLYVTAGAYTVYMPSDLYYACLDGTYNSDMDSRWGEPNDGDGGGDVDLFAEVYVGRACIDSIDEMENFVAKTIAYEQTDDSYIYEVWLLGEYLGFGGVAEWGGNYKDEFIDYSDAHGYFTFGFPSQIYNIHTLYDRDYSGNNWPPSEIINIIDNNAVHLINHLGHSWYDYNMKLYISDVEDLTNTKYFFVYSQGCMAGGFDSPYGYDCIAEVFTVSEHGAFGGVWNARYGWGASYSTDGPSQRYDREFWDAVYGENYLQIGRANHDSKEDNAYRINEQCMRWCYYETNLFGDPTVKIKGTETEAELSYDPYVYNFGVVQEGQTYQTTFEIWNSGDGTLVYSLHDNYDWLTYSPTQGESTGEHDTITVTIDTTGLGGTYYGYIYISSNGGSGAFQVIFYIPSGAELSYYPTSHDFGLIQEGQTYQTTFEIWNSGDGTLNWHLSDEYNWLTYSPENGENNPFEPHDIVTVYVDTTGLLPTVYVGEIEITSNGGNATFVVTFAIEGPRLAYSPDYYYFGDLYEGETSTMQFEIWNNGTDTLYYNISEYCSWVNVEPTTGTSIGEHDVITVTINTTGLYQGYHSCNIYIDSNGGMGTVVVAVNVIPYTNEYYLELYEGWNFITLPFENNYTASSLYQDIPNCNVILKWDALSQDFIVYIPSSPYDFAIEDGIGYFIAVTNNSNLSIEGKRIYEVNITLYGGWNCLGWINEEPIKASSLYENISYCNILLTWNTSKQNFDLYVPSSPYDFTIKQGEGFMVAVTQQTWLVLK